MLKSFEQAVPEGALTAKARSPLVTSLDVGTTSRVISEDLGLRHVLSTLARCKTMKSSKIQ